MRPYVRLDAKPNLLCGAGETTLTWSSEKVTNIRVSFASGTQSSQGSSTQSVSGTTTFWIEAESSLGPRQDREEVGVAVKNAHVTLPLSYQSCAGDRATYTYTEGPPDKYLATEQIKSVKNLSALQILLSFQFTIPLAPGQATASFNGRPSGTWTASAKLPLGEQCPPAGPTQQPPPSVPPVIQVRVTYGCS